MILTIFIQKLYIEVLLQKEHLLFYDVGPRRQRKMLVVLAVEAEPSHQCCITFCCCVTDGSSGAVWQMASDMEVCMEQRCESELLHAEKKWNSLAFIDTCWTFMETKQWMRAQWGGGWCISAVATVTWKTSHILDGHADCYKRSMQALFHHWWKCLANGDCVEKICFVAETLLYQLVFLCSL